MSDKIWHDDERGPWDPEKSRPRPTSDPIWAPEAPPPAPPAPSSPPPSLWDPAEGAPAPPPPTSLWRSDEGRADEPRGPRGQKVHIRRRRKRYGWLSYAGAAGGFLVAMFIADGLFVINGLKDSLEITADSFQAAQSAASEGDIAGARSALATALDAAGRARSLTRHPAMALGALIPQTSTDVRALAGLAEASRLGAEAGASGVEAAMKLEVGEGGVGPALYSGSALQLDAIRATQPFTEETDRLLSEAMDILTAIEPTRIPLITEAVEKALAEFGTLAEAARKGDALASLLPEMFDGDQSYLIVVQTLGESRATGGLFGVQAILEANSGHIELRGIRPIKDVLTSPSASPVQAPAWFEANYGPQSALVAFQQVNVSPNFPVVAATLLEMYEAQRGLRFDGVVAMDAVSFAHLLGSVDSLPAPEIDSEVTSATIVEVLLEDSYLNFDSEDAQNAFFGALIERFWDKVTTGQLDLTKLALSVGESGRTHHLKVFLQDRNAMSAMQSLGITGDYTDAGPNPQLVFANNYGANKIDYYLRRSVETKVALQSSGEAVVTTEVTLKNTAPSSPPGVLIGTGSATDPPGLNRMQLCFLLPRGSDLDELVVNGTEQLPLVYSDGDHPVAWRVIDIPSGRSASIELTYVIPDAAIVADGSGRFQFTLVPWASVVTEDYRLSVAAPPGHTFPAGRIFSAEGTLDSPLSLTLDLAPRG